MTAQPKKKMGRPPKPYDPKIGDLICEMIADGKSIVDCAQVKGVPSRTTIYHWLNTCEDFANNYERAREQRADYLAHQVVDIADTDEDYQRARNRMDARKWAAGKMAPKRYGDRLNLAGTGDKDDAIHVETHNAALEEITRRIAGLASRSDQNGGDQSAET